MTEETKVTLYKRRWVVLGTFMLINLMIQILWICYAPMSGAVAQSFGVKTESVDLLANLFMLIYLPVAFPAAWAIDKIGFKKAVGFGAVLMALFGGLRASFPQSYSVALIGTIGIAIGQPFLLNAFTKLAALWFPKSQRATITGVIFLACFLGIGIGETVSPMLVGAYGLGGMQMIYGVAAAAAALLFLIFARSEPPTPASPEGEEVRALVLDGLKSMLKKRDTYFLGMALFFGSGIVNGVFTLIDGIGKEKGMTMNQDVILAGALLLSGVIGCAVLPWLSDAIRRRRNIVIVGICVGFPATIGLALFRSFGLELIAFFLLGFFITGVTPVAYQYGAEISHPTPEGTSNGIFALIVQASGILIVLMNSLKKLFHNSYVPSLVFLAVCTGISGFILLANRESPEMGRKKGAVPAAEALAEEES